MKSTGVKTFFKQLFCRHKDLLVMCVYYGDLITWRGRRTEYFCKKCGKIIYK